MMKQFTLLVAVWSNKLLKIANSPSLVVGFILAFQPFVSSNAVAAARVSCSQGATMNIVAHQDDDLLFQSPDLIQAIKTGCYVRTVYVTAGDAGADSSYWSQRELGEKAAYAQMGGVSNSWTQTDAGISGHPIPVFTLNGKPNVSLAFLRLPDGNGDGSGFFNYGYESLQKLWLESITTIHTVDGSSSYSKSDLIGTLAALMNNFKPAQIRSLDYSGALGDGDHSDHHVSAYFVRAAHWQYPLSHTLTGYEGYNIAYKPQNVFSKNLTAKKNAFYAYAAFDPSVCDNDAACQGTGYDLWLLRQYTIGSETGPNFAAQASVTASSENWSTGQTAIKAIDGIILGYPDAIHYDKEWATVGGREGSYLKLSWPSPKIVSRIVLYDRPNLDDHITNATLTFSDGTFVTTGPLINNGSRVTINFPARSVISVQLDILSVSGPSGSGPGTANIGLAEIEVF